jgi:hypothetical protein
VEIRAVHRGAKSRRRRKDRFEKRMNGYARHIMGDFGARRLGLSLGGANAGTCVNRQDGTDTVEACDNASYTVTDRHGHRRVYGTPNAGFERYPGQGERPVIGVQFLSMGMSKDMAAQRAER